MDKSVRFSNPILEGALAQWDAGERALIDAPDPQGDGGFYQRERIAAGALWAVSKFPGDLVEVGCLNGSTTVRLAEVARNFGRRVVAIDPFILGTQNVNGGELEIFTETIKPYADIIDFMRLRSDDPRVIETLKGRELAMAFVDGLHTFEGAWGDLRRVSHAGLIALDDTRAMSDVRNALGVFRSQDDQENRAVITRDDWRESWIV